MLLLPNHPFGPLGLAAALGHRGRRDEARAVFATIRPGLAPRILELVQSAEQREVLTSGLAAAGIDV